MSSPLLESVSDIYKDRPCPNDYEIELSKAISLKRIADALHGTPDRLGLLDIIFEMVDSQ